jgi:putative oxidoreductase
MTEEAKSNQPSLLGRLLYGGVLAYMGFDGFRNNAKRVEAARNKGVPAPEFLVPFVTGLLTVGGLGIVSWRKPRLAAGTLVAFFIGTTPAIHNFWDLDEGRQDNKIHFLKNSALLGAAIVLLKKSLRHQPE